VRRFFFADSPRSVCALRLGPPGLAPCVSLAWTRWSILVSFNYLFAFLSPFCVTRQATITNQGVCFFFLCDSGPGVGKTVAEPPIHTLRPTSRIPPSCASDPPRIFHEGKSSPSLSRPPTIFVLLFSGHNRARHYQKSLIAVTGFLFLSKGCDPFERHL